MKTHIKKLVQPYFDYVRFGIKKFELRKNDCDYQVGDILILREYDPNSDLEFYSEITTRITYILEGYEGIQDGYCILGIEVLKDER